MLTLVRSRCRCELLWLLYHSACNAATRFQQKTRNYFQHPGPNAGANALYPLVWGMQPCALHGTIQSLPPCGLGLTRFVDIWCWHQESTRRPTFTTSMLQMPLSTKHEDYARLR
ncbi:hypothetical protein BDN71DRAFT_665112 [Pleurotus eryngii]|uniref:Uncharacterized protein n=1 Tax=Pleurotus eryngii TaxID=5323 RepID=A0A9P6D065_PLEER|nr:hypothetical protein BDN71DRAFT_665112 [Pleurotus eryngii]